MKFAGDVLHWTEEGFWSCGFAFFRATWEGWAIASGVKKVGPKAPSREEYETAKAALAARETARDRLPSGGVGAPQSANR